jgi:hypothetical protein
MTPALSAARERHNAGDAVAAAALFRTAVASEPDNPQAWQLLAAHLLLRDAYPGAEVCARRAVALDPGYADGWATLGVVLHREEQYEMAMAAHDRSLKIWPDFVNALRNRGATRFAMGDLEGSLADYEAACRCGFPAAELLCDMAFPVLASGDFQRGLELAEQRDTSGALVSALGIPAWMGEDISKQTILVHQDQGYGDTLMWAALLPALKKRAKRVVLSVDRGLFRLFRRDYETILQPGEVPGDIDCQVPICSLPHWFGVEEFPVKYIAPPEDRILMPVPRAPALKIGVSWSGERRKLYGLQKAMPFECLMPLVLLPGVQLYSLQVGSDDLVTSGANAFIHDMAPMIRDFLDTAAIVKRLDLVVTIDSALMHLCGAMGVPTLALLPYATEWRWYPRDEDHATRWYPSVTVLMQDAPHNWMPQIERACAIIAPLAPVA